MSQASKKYSSSVIKDRMNSPINASKDRMLNALHALKSVSGEDDLTDIDIGVTARRKSFAVIDMAYVIADLGERMEEYERESRDAKEKKDGSAAIYYDNAASEANDRSRQLRDSLSCYEALTLEEAMVQIAEAISQIDGLDDEMPEYERKKTKLAIDRLLFSSFRAIERAASRSLISIGLEKLHNWHCDPWEDVSLRLSRVKAETSSQAHGSGSA